MHDIWCMPHVHFTLRELKLCWKMLAGALQLSSWESFVTGGIARSVASVVTCPITVVKTQMEYAGHGVKHKVSMASLNVLPAHVDLYASNAA